MGHIINLVLGVELNKINDLLWNCRTCLLTKNKQLVRIESQQMIEGSLPVIFEALPRAYPMALTLTGKGIIHKNIQIAEGLDADQIFQSAFPAIESNQFYIQQFIEAECVLLSMIRKQELDGLIEQLKQAGLSLFIISLGAIVSTSIWSQLNLYDSEIHFDGHSFQRNSEGLFLTYQYKPEQNNRFTLKLGQESIADQQVLAYATAFQLLLHQQINLINANVEEVNQRFANFLFHSRLKKKAIQCLLSLLMALVISLGLFKYYNEENTKRLQALGAFTANADQQDRLKNKITENEKLLKRLNWNSGYNYGFLINEIGSVMPKQLQLLEISMSELKPDLTIIGLTNSLGAINNWIFTLKEKPWVSAVSLVKYQENVGTNQYQFNLMITYGNVAETGR